MKKDRRYTVILGSTSKLREHVRGKMDTNCLHDMDDNKQQITFIWYFKLNMLCFIFDIFELNNSI